MPALPTTRLTPARLSLAACLACATLVATFGAAVTARPAAAQPTRRDTANAPTLPREVARDAAVRFNAPTTTRVFGPYEVPTGRRIDGDVAVLDGPVTIAGHVAGRLTVINADVTLRPGARIDGDLFVVGGVVDGRLDADLRGDYQSFRQPLQYTRSDDRLSPVLTEDESGTWWRWRRTAIGPQRRTTAGLTLSSGRTYNRVEGLPIHFGPSLEHDFGGGSVLVEALGIFRTAEQFSWDSANVGHLVRAELRLGDGFELRAGGRLYDVVAPVETWQLDPAETGFAAFLLRRDFRDYFGRHGGAGYVSLFAGRDASITLSLADERWATRGARDVFTLFRNDATWRPNPVADEGRVHVLNTTLLVDTRNDVEHPWAGWYVEADYERGTGEFTSIAPTSASFVPDREVEPTGVLGLRDLTPGRRTYGRAFVDVRRYNRLTPDAQLNFRLAFGGWLHGDQLPMQRRFSLTGPGALAGFDFRQPATVSSATSDVGQCTVGGVEPAGSPAQCERMALAQVEYRGDIRVRLFGDDDEGRVRRRAWRTDLSWVVFADAGRGWLVGPRDAGESVYPRGSLPPIGSFLADVGAGIDFGHSRANDLGSFGIYVAKAVTRPSPGANVFVRIRRRF
ncbi:MAG: hypothetical protein ACXW61_06690 [Gemmatirosa sp.]